MNIIAQRCDFSTGDLVDGKYRIEKTLGQGTFGMVFLTRKDGVEYAMKVLKLWEVPSTVYEQLTDRFQMEYETGLIGSEYLVRNVDYGQVLGNPYIVMEFCSGGDLYNVWCSGKLDIDKVARHVLYGLDDLHKRGKVHRDLKPENVLLKGNGDYVLTDFGISGDRNRRLTDGDWLGRPKQRFGTIPYMPPEQLVPKSKAVTILPTTDIFSYGVMMYYLLTGQLPFGQLKEDGDEIDYMKNARNGNWDRNTLKNINSEWMDVIEGCLESNYKDRLQTVDKVLALLPKAYNSVADTRKPMIDDCNKKIINGVLLKVMQGEEYGREYRLDDMLTSDYALITMGRMDAGVNNKINLKETLSNYISRRHCTFELDYDSGAWVVRDGQWYDGEWHKSTNGTFVNSTKVGINGAPFYPGDIISVGDMKLRAEGY